MHPRITSMLDVVMADLGDHLASADRLCAEYARAYVASLNGGPQVRAPASLHPQLAKLVRELALDAASTHHHYPTENRNAA